MIAQSRVGPDTATHLRWRLLRSYVLSRRLPGYWLMLLVLLVLVVWGADWGTRHAPTTSQMLVFILPVATSSVLGVSLWSPFGETERSAGTWLPLGRITHLLLMLIMTLAVNQVALELWVPVSDPTRWDIYLLRHTLALTGLAVLASTIVDTRLSWIASAMVAMSGLVMGYVRVESSESRGSEVAFFHEGATHLMLRLDDSIVAFGIALALFIAGLVSVVRRGERLTGPEDTAG